MIDNYRARLNQLKGKRDTVKSDLDKKEITKKNLIQEGLYLEECRIITQLISETNQKKLTERIDTFVTDCIQSVFGDEYEFKMVITSKNNSISATPTFYKDGREETVKASQGGGMLAIASLALRIILMTLLKDPTKILILDEAFSALGPENGGLERGVQLMNTISEKMGIQCLCITHGDEIKQKANRVFHVSMKEKDHSKVTTKDNIKEILQEDL